MINPEGTEDDESTAGDVQPTVNMNYVGVDIEDKDAVW